MVEAGELENLSGGESGGAGGGVCNVTADLRDLSGRSGLPSKFVFLTEAGVSTSITIRETFANSTKQEALISGGVWGGPQGAGARPGLVGGDGRHGSFDPNLGQAVGGGLFIWNVDNLLIPASSSLTGLQYTVNDGQFFFTDMVIPEGQTIRFVGSVAPVIHVRGQVDVRGTIEVNGADAAGSNAITGLAIGQKVSNFNALGALLGQAGTVGGAGGGSGGAGADRCNNTGPIIVGGINTTDGQPGSDVRLLAAHAYSGSALGTGGLGSQLTPATGIWATPVPIVGPIYCGYFSPGGAGGGFQVAGGIADLPVYVGTNLIVSTPRVAGGSSFSLLPYPPASPPANYTSLEHFTVGGSGGGGGGSHGYGIVTLGTVTQRFMAGHGGTGGGGAVAIRSGGTSVFGSTAVLSARGGDGVLIRGTSGANPPATTGISSPGGAGSGGSFLLQSAQSVSVAGTVNTRGGNGSTVGFIDNSLQRVNGAAGDGAAGFFRLEAPSGNVSFGGTSTPAYVPATMSGNLTDRDDLSGDSSLWYTTGLVFPPTWNFYELDVDLDGNGTIDITYTGSGLPGTV